MHSLCFKNFKKLNKSNLNNILEKSRGAYSYNSYFKCFSKTDSKPELAFLNEILFMTKEDKDLKYEDACFHFEKEWKKLQEDKLKKKQDYMSSDLTDHQKKECDILIETILKFNAFESRYFNYVLRDSFENNAGAEPFRPNVFEKRKKFEFNLSTADDNPNNKNTQELLSVLIPFISSGYFAGGGGAGAPAQKQAEKSKAEEPKKEKEAEKVLVRTILTFKETKIRY
jgi:hypothetical protein